MGIKQRCCNNNLLFSAGDLSVKRLLLRRRRARAGKKSFCISAPGIVGGRFMEYDKCENVPDGPYTIHGGKNKTEGERG